ncbi:hypothetical protein HDV00_011800 [Rhizophlyctis rosea]|nr:hypothetical protein HDV00_011800 [Rhizophlyctis rosea]
MASGVPPPTWSDGTASTHPDPPYEPDDGDANYRIRLGATLVDLYKQHPDKNPLGRTDFGESPILNALPAGYKLFAKARQNTGGKTGDKYLCGHPNGAKYRSVNEFEPHFIWMVVNAEHDYGQCTCKYCPSYARSLGIPVSTPSKPPKDSLSTPTPKREKHVSKANDLSASSSSQSKKGKQAKIQTPELSSKPATTDRKLSKADDTATSSGDKSLSGQKFQKKPKDAPTSTPIPPHSNAAPSKPTYRPAIAKPMPSLPSDSKRDLSPKIGTSGLTEVHDVTESPASVPASISKSKGPSPTLKRPSAEGQRPPTDSNKRPKMDVAIASTGRASSYRVGDMVWVRTFINPKDAPNKIYLENRPGVDQSVDIGAIIGDLTYWPAVVREIAIVGERRSTIPQVSDSPFLIEHQEKRSMAKPAHLYNNFDLAKQKMNVCSVEIMRMAHARLWVKESHIYPMIAYRPPDDWLLRPSPNYQIADELVRTYLDAIRVATSYADNTALVLGGQAIDVKLPSGEVVRSWREIQWGPERIALGDVVRAREGEDTQLSAKNPQFGAYRILAMRWDTRLKGKITFYAHRMTGVVSSDENDPTYFRIKHDGSGTSSERASHYVLKEAADGFTTFNQDRLMGRFYGKAPTDHRNIGPNRKGGLVNVMVGDTKMLA